MSRDDVESELKESGPLILADHELAQVERLALGSSFA
jgi:hypothetical protein